MVLVSSRMRSCVTGSLPFAPAAYCTPLSPCTAASMARRLAAIKDRARGPTHSVPLFFPVNNRKKQEAGHNRRVQPSRKLQDDNRNPRNRRRVGRPALPAITGPESTKQAQPGLAGRPPRAFVVNINSCRTRRAKLSPYPSCRLAHPLELASFVLDGQVVSNDRRGKSALRAERQAFQRHKAARLRDATNEVFRRLHLRPLGADQSEDHRLVIRDVPQRCERARPLIVVFEQKPRCTDALENRPGNRLIVARDEPTTFLVATTEMDGEGHVGKSRHDGVVELDPAAQPLIERPASRL